MPNIVYYGMDWLCPTYTSVFHDQLQKHYGNISAVNTIQDIVPIVQTGDLHIAIYDLVSSCRNPNLNLNLDPNLYVYVYLHLLFNLHTIIPLVQREMDTWKSCLVVVGANMVTDSHPSFLARPSFQRTELYRLK
jgi:hypothetical protein